WWPSVHAAVQYYERNLGWTVISDTFPGEAVCVGPQGKREARCKAFRLPDPLFEPSFEDFRAF
ncbi:class I SAM-dependent methyltransferase, partial [Streptomyces puniciscabiei]